MEYTREQERAVKERGKDILVSAGAGAGKTRVLVNRMVEMILDENDPVSADEFLVMTFTNAAAQEMKERIVAELSARLEKCPGGRDLRRQIRLVRHADISTVHSFCNRLLRTHSHELGLDPSFRIGEEGELFLLRRQAMEDLLEESYAGGRESFFQLAEAYAPDKSDRILEDMIDGLYRFSRGFPNAKRWLGKMQKQAEELGNPDTMDDTPAMKIILERAEREVFHAAKRAEEGLALFGSPQEPERFYILLRQDREILAGLEQAETYEEYYNIFSQLHLSDLPRAKKEEKAWRHLDKIKEIHKEIRELLNTLKEECFSYKKEEISEENRQLLPLIHECILLAARFEELYFENKKEKNVYDFDDLEHLALDLLVENWDENGTPLPSETAKELAGKYRAVFVDEYQDTSLVQETLIRVLTGQAQNHLFVVGDVKQSIYRFRQARPDLFLNRYEVCRKGEKGSLCLELRDNFRSAPGVLSFCNDVFAKLMTKNFGGLDYTGEIALRPGKNGPMSQCGEISEALLLVDDEEREQLGGGYDPVAAESAVIAKRIRALREEGYEYKDMVILFRSGAIWAEPVAAYLRMWGIPAVCDSRTGYFNTREVRVILNYLAVVDNVYQDIPMASVMLSPIGGFTEEELAKLKIHAAPPLRREYAVYDLIHLYIEEGEEAELARKLKKFLDQLAGFRKKKKEKPIHELLWEIYQETGFYYDVMLMPEGERRKENLLMLLQKAEEYEKTVFKGLFYFIRYMEQLREYEVEIGEAPAYSQSEEGVRIMTIHKSKGLEFPVVFVSGLSKRFNLMDGNRPVLCHPDLGLGLEYVDVETRTRDSSLLKKAIREIMKKDSLEEELRILYVAMTRAQKKLILTGVIKKDAFDRPEEEAVSLEEKLSARSFMDWLIPVFQNPGSLSGYKIRLLHFHELPDLNRREEEKKESASFDEMVRRADITEDLTVVSRAFAYEYPYREAALRKRKYSVSEIKKLSMTAPETGGMEDDPAPGGPRDVEEGIPEPDFLRDEKPQPGPAERGTRIHKIMELLSFQKIDSRKALFDEMRRVEEQYPQAKDISMGRLYAALESFFFSPVGEALRRMDREGALYKELPFTIGLPFSLADDPQPEAPAAADEEMAVVQGVIDLCGEGKGGFWLLDYKTDRIKPGQEGLLLDRYRKQMLYYKLALERIWRKPVIHSYIYSFSLKKYIKVDLL